MKAELEVFCDALVSRALNTIDARRWLHRLDERAEREGWLLTVPDFPLVDSDGDPVEVAFVWNDAFTHTPIAVVEFTDALVTFRVHEDDDWQPCIEGVFITVLGAWHREGRMAQGAPPQTPMDTRGVVDESNGGLGITVLRGGVEIPVDPNVGLAPMTNIEGAGAAIADEAEEFLKEQGGD